jgi:VanZ family protein
MAGRSANDTLLPWVPAALWMAVIFGASSLPGSAIPGGWSVEGHAIEYLVLAILLYLPARRRMPPLRAALFAVAVASLYGVTDELHQFLTPGRTPDVMDWLTDTLAAAAGVAVAWAWVGRRERAAGTGERQ